MTRKEQANLKIEVGGVYWLRLDNVDFMVHIVAYDRGMIKYVSIDGTKVGAFLETSVIISDGMLKECREHKVKKLLSEIDNM